MAFNTNSKFRGKSSDYEEELVAESTTADGFNVYEKLQKLIGRLKDSKTPNCMEQSEWQEECDEDYMTRTKRSECSSNYVSYDISRNQPGLALLVINSFEDEPNLFRPMAEEDCKYASKLFDQLGFQIETIENTKSEGLLCELQEVRRKITPDYDCFVCVISSHGAEMPVSQCHYSNSQFREHMIAIKDGYISTGRILQEFNDVNCPNLKGKPKIFFIQACRSVYIDTGSNEHENDMDKGCDLKVKGSTSNNPEVEGTITESKENPAISDISSKPAGVCIVPCFEDYLVMFASAPGRVAWSGWFMFCLYKVFKNLLDCNFETDLLNILTAVSREMSCMNANTNNPITHDTKAAATIYHMLTKPIVLKRKACGT